MQMHNSISDYSDISWWEAIGCSMRLWVSAAGSICIEEVCTPHRVDEAVGQHVSKALWRIYPYLKKNEINKTSKNANDL